MANINAPAGLVPYSYQDGNVWNGKTTTYYIASSDTNAYAIGDPMTLVTGGADANGVMGVTLATAGTANVVVGALMGGTGGTVYGGSVRPGYLDTTIIPATKTVPYYVQVCDDANVLFSIQEGGSHALLTMASVGKNFNLLSGTNNGYVSGWMLDNNTSGTGATIQLRVMRLLQQADNVPGTYQKWVVMINEHQFSAGVVGI